ncbi:MAG TPA: hypothetical protein VJT67_11325 [Longimicrobiaceae bacterium]|nr:hypothetical protein [Longimicrobiaceae bacterium]
MRLTLLTRSALVLFACAACADEPTPTTPPVQPEPKPAPVPVGVFEISVEGIGTDNMTATTRTGSVSNGPSATLTPVASGLSLETVSTGSFIEGSRTAGGQRYLTFTFRLRNASGASLNNLTLLAVQRPNTIPGTPISSLKKFDGTNADTSLAKFIVPTGVVTLGSDLVNMQATYPDVLQAFTEAEVAAITPPGDITGILPYGYMVRSKLSNANRTLANTADPNQWDGLVTLSFRVPLQATSALDVYQITFQLLGVTDTETRLTESIEESQDTAAVRRLRDRATSLGATTVTVLNGSPAMDAAVPDYPGQRQICNLRTAGTAGSPVTFVNAPGPYTQIFMMHPGESLSSCSPYFITGTPSRPALNVVYQLTLREMDRYGNQKNVADTVHIDDVSGPPYLDGGSTAMSGGQTAVNVVWSDYGTSVMNVIGRRNMGQRSILVAGVTRTWTAGAGTTDWNTGNNWSPAAVPGTLDSVYVPLSAPLDPALASNVSILGVTVEDGALIALSAFNLTAGGNVTVGTSGGITNTSGRLVLTGVAKTLQGKVAPIRVQGTYSLTGNVTSRAPIQVDAGRLTVSGYRLQGESN